MRYIIAVIKPSRVDEVIEAVTRAGATGLTVTEVRGYGRQKGRTEIYRGAEYEIRLVPKVRLDIAAPEALAAPIVAALTAAAHTGKIGDGKIFILGLRAALRIRTGEEGEDALGD